MEYYLSNKFPAFIECELQPKYFYFFIEWIILMDIFVQIPSWLSADNAYVVPVIDRIVDFFLFSKK